MSMTKQLWIAILLSTTLALGGSLFASLFSAHNYLTEQLTLKNHDNANALALSLTQGDIDDVRVELTVAAMFDSGQYQRINISNPLGKTIVERRAPSDATDVPQWFIKLLPINAAEGKAQINRGWQQYGIVTLQSETRFAYRTLWNSAVQVIAAMAFCGFLAGYLGTLILRRLIPPLHAVVDQAHEITQRRFTTIAPSKVPELARLAEAMNQMVKRLRAMFDHEAARLETVRREANYDDVTNLPNRHYFMGRLSQALNDGTGGMLILMRIAQLADINHRLGRPTTDELLKRVAAPIDRVAAKSPAAFAGRLSGADFALFYPEAEMAIPQALLNLIMSEAPRYDIDPEQFIHIGAVTFTSGADIRQVLSQADTALASIENSGHSGFTSNPLNNIEGPPRNADDWGRMLQQAVAQRWARLQSYPVVDANGQVLHHECLLRLRFEGQEEWLPAGHFLPIAERLRMTTEIDLLALTLAFEAWESGTISEGIAINLSPQSIADVSFCDQVIALIGKHRRFTDKLWLELSEAGALRHLDAISKLCRQLEPLGCRVGIEHFGNQFSQIGRLHNLGLTYLKIDSSFTQGIDSDAGNQGFLQGVRSITQAAGLLLLAEGVTTDAELQRLIQLGFDGATGPGIRLP